MFMRFKKFQMTEAFKKMESCIVGVFKNKDVLNFGDENIAKMLELYEEEVMVPLTERTADGQKLVSVRFGRFDPDKFSHYDLLRLIIYVLSVLSEEEETQISGVSFIIDCADTTMKHLFGPKFLSDITAISSFLGVLRFKESYIINLPSFAKVIADICMKLLSQKLEIRLTILDDPSDLSKHIDSSSLSEEYGGTHSIKKSMKEFLDLEKEKRSLVLCGYNYSQNWDASALSLIRSGEDDEGTGSFRKLEID
jgi:hypothetical protein